MLIRRIDAAFSKACSQTLTLSDGLNILQASSEAGKAAWCSLLLSMFYGVGPEERGFPAGALPISGRLDCRAGDDALVLLRDTRRSDAPLEEFRAFYAGTDTPVPGLGAANCGEALLGVNRKIFAAGILAGNPISGQAGNAERRIAALIRSGGGDASCHEASSGKAVSDPSRTGRLPALEAKLQETESQLAIHSQLIRKLEWTREQAVAAKARTAALEKELTALGYQELRQQRLALQLAGEAADQAERRAADLRRRITEEGIPETETAGRLRGAIVNWETARKAAVKAREERDRAERTLRQAEEAAAGSSFAGLTPEEAEQRSMDLPPKPHFPLWGLVLALALGFAPGAALHYIKGTDILLALGCGCGLAGLVLLLLGFFTGKRQSHWKAQAAQRRAQWQKALDTHAALCRDLETAQADYTEKSAAYDTLSNTLTAGEEGILREIRVFAPAVSDIASGDAALRASAILRKGLAEADATAREARLRYEELAQEELPADSEPPQALPTVSRSRAAITADLEEARAALSALRSDAGQLVGRLDAAGDPAALRAAAERLADGIATLKREEAAAKAAPDPHQPVHAVSHGHSPSVLARRTAEVFSQLAGDADSREVLTWLLQTASGKGGPLGAVLSSPEAAAQLELAARLAACQLTFPAEKVLPMILDGALTAFEGPALSAALRWLHGEAAKRQLLLFTCSSREAAYFAGDPTVSIQYLTDLPE